jgi:hypothetical protein
LTHQKYVCPIEKINPKFIQVVLFFLLFVFVYFLPTYSGHSWGLIRLILRLTTFSLLLLGILNIFIEKSTIQTKFFAFILMACVVGNIFYFRFAKIPPLRQLPSSSFSTIEKLVFTEESDNLITGLDQYLYQSTLVVSPGLLEEADISASNLISSMLLNGINFASYQSTLTEEQAKDLLFHPYVRWERLDGSSYYLIKQMEKKTIFFLARYKSDWMLIPEEYLQK